MPVRARKLYIQSRTSPAVVAWNSVERAGCCRAPSGPEGIWQLQPPLDLRVTTHGPRPAKPLSLQRCTACKNERVGEHGLRPRCRRGHVNCIYRIETSPAVVAWNSVERAGCCRALIGPEGIWLLQQPLELRMITHGAQPRPAKPFRCCAHSSNNNLVPVAKKRTSPSPYLVSSWLLLGSSFLF